MTFENNKKDIYTVDVVDLQTDKKNHKNALVL